MRADKLTVDLADLKDKYENKFSNLSHILQELEFDETQQRTSKYKHVIDYMN